MNGSQKLEIMKIRAKAKAKKVVAKHVQLWIAPKPQLLGEETSLSAQPPRGGLDGKSSL